MWNLLSEYFLHFFQDDYATMVDQEDQNLFTLKKDPWDYFISWILQPSWAKICKAQMIMKPKREDVIVQI